MTEKSHILQSGNNFEIFSGESFTIHDTLPVRTYSVVYDERQDKYSLQPISDFVLPEKLYGDCSAKADRILNTFAQRKLSTGVHLDGIKGSGKTLLAKLLSAKGAELGYPTIVINQPYFGETFNKFIQNIDAAAIILFDEFEKVYPDQSKILTLFDGVYPTKKMFVITTNATWKVSEFLKNRPGRMYYSLSFKNLDARFVREYCQDRLDNKDNIEEIVRYASVFSAFNFDMLAASVEEMNRYSETLAEVVEYLNIIPETVAGSYEVTVELAGKKHILSKEFEMNDINDTDYYLNSNSIRGLSAEDQALWNTFLECNEDDSHGDLVVESNHLFGYCEKDETFTYRLPGHNDTYVDLKMKKIGYTDMARRLLA